MNTKGKGTNYFCTTDAFQKDLIPRREKTFKSDEKRNYQHYNHIPNSRITLSTSSSGTFSMRET